MALSWSNWAFTSTEDVTDTSADGACISAVKEKPEKMVSDLSGISLPSGRHIVFGNSKRIFPSSH